MSTDRFMSCTEDQAGKRASVNERHHRHYPDHLLLVISAEAQNPPETDDPDASRGNPKSPDGAYEWVVRADTSIRYELIDHSNRQKIMTVSAYYPDVDSANIRYARASGFFWNQDGTIVALDELNRRRAGRLYFFTLRS